MGSGIERFDIEYRPRTTIKGQVLVDFIVKRSEARKRKVDNEKWVLEIDGSSRAHGRGVMII